jgi:S-DNA-T family DNA segregation ATPase FtsK/SpoIIIE
MLRLLAAAWILRHGDEAVLDLRGGLGVTGRPEIDRSCSSGSVDAATLPPTAGSADPTSRSVSRSPARSGVGSADVLAALLDGLAGRQDPLLVLLDDADRIDDPLGRISAAIETLPPSVHLAVAIRSDVTHVRHGHWTAAVRRSGRGFVAATGIPYDGDLLGVLLPRRVGIAWRPGLWWMVGRAGAELIQAATAEPWPSRSTVTAGMMEA